MHSTNLRVPFQQCRRRGTGKRLFLPLGVQIVEYLLRFTDGAQERYQVVYTASIETEKSQQRWRYRGHVSRQLSIYNMAGERFDKADVDRRLELSPDVGHNSVADWHGWRECTSAPGSALPEDEFDEVFQWLTKAFAASVVTDKRRVESHFRHIYKGIEAISEIG